MRSLLLVAALLSGQESTLAARVKGLIAKAGSADPAEAHAAMDLLVDLGPPALSLLEADAKNCPRIARVMQDIRFEAAHKEMVRPPKRISLSASERRADSVLGDLAKLAGQELNVEDLQDSPAMVTVGLEQETFWRAADQICKAGNVDLARYGSADVTSEAYVDVPRFAYRNYYLRPTGLHRVKEVDFRGKPDWRWSLEFGLVQDAGGGAAAWGRIRWKTVVDDTGKELSIANALPERDEWCRLGDGDTPLAPALLRRPPKPSA
jgi:hypothetical protein